MHPRMALEECPRCGMEVEPEVLDGHLIWFTEYDDRGTVNEQTLRLCEESAG